MKPSQTIIKEVQDTKELEHALKSLSEQGGAWVHSILPFSHTTTFMQFNNPSSVPDCYYDTSRSDKHPLGRIGYQGKLVGFTKAARIREQNRGYSGDR